MAINNEAGADSSVREGDELHLSEIVLGLQWEPTEDPATSADLDALCVLLDGKQRVLEIIHPGKERNANGSIIHTGDSRTGASKWDDERIIVFLKALPDTVAMLRFIVASSNGLAFDRIRGASCHISDRITEDECFRLNLNTLAGNSAYHVATLHLTPTGLRIYRDVQAVSVETLAKLAPELESAKRLRS